uniref:phosphoribosylformylglycinamidine synthase n=1 Tax=Fulvivirga sp. TaxID=1931237 RepID=UPI004049D0B4
MISYFQNAHQQFFILQHQAEFSTEDHEKLTWLLNGAKEIPAPKGKYIGPRVEMITPWSTNAVEIAQNMGIEGIIRMEQLSLATAELNFDPMLQSVYENPDQAVFNIDRIPEPVKFIEDIASYNNQEGLALSIEEIEYLDSVSKEMGRKLTDSEVFGFSQVNSEHCRHKIFNGTFIIDGETKPNTLFQLIKETSKQTPGRLVSAYKDNVAFIAGPKITQFAPKTQDKPDFFEEKPFESILSLKAETHNFPTTVEPFNGAATGSGGEIRDRMAGGKGSIPLAGTAVYMTSYSRLAPNRPWEASFKERKWLYRSPSDILIKASNGASDFGNKFGQPLICGSVLTFEHQEDGKALGYDKVIMQAGGIGYGKASESHKDHVEKGDKIVILGGDNYRIGMGGGSVSSVDTGKFSNKIELNAVQRSNPEMQKRVANAIRAMVEMDKNPLVSIHDHGAGGHLNCLSELVEESGGTIDLDKLPVGDPTLSAKEIIGNESQERMGLVMKEADVPLLQKIAARERAPFYVVGEATGDHRFLFRSKDGKHPMDWKLSHMFGTSPKTVLNDTTSETKYSTVAVDDNQFTSYLDQVLQLESVACKDWLTNKVDRCVTGRVAKQQTTGEIQLPLNNVGVMALDFSSNKGVATSIGHAPVAALVNVEAGSRLAIAEALTNLIWAPLEGGLDAVSLSANWMWPAKNNGENDRLYRAVEAVSQFAIALGINIPTGKDSLSMTQKYPDGSQVLSPGTVIISSVAEVSDIRKVVTPELKNQPNSKIYYIPFTKNMGGLAGSSLSQILNHIGGNTADIEDASYFRSIFTAIQQLINDDKIFAGHDVSAGGLVTTLLEMNFPNQNGGLNIDLTQLSGSLSEIAFNETPALVIQASNSTGSNFDKLGIKCFEIGGQITERKLKIASKSKSIDLDIDTLRDTWYLTSHLLDSKQTSESHANARFENYKNQPLKYNFPETFTGKLSQWAVEVDKRKSKNIVAAIIREKGVNSDREMAYMLHMAGFKVKDVHMTDLIHGREDLTEVDMIVFVGGFSNSDVLGSAKGWAGAFKYNERAKNSLANFFARPDTLSLGVCNGCQLAMELGLIYPEMGDSHPKMHHNASGKFECTFTAITISENHSIMLSSLADTTLGIWSAHGEGQFIFEGDLDQYNIIGKYHHNAYPANPNGSQEAAAVVCSADGRHLAMMPHLERSMFPWNWPHYPSDRKSDDVSPWIEAFMNAASWIEKNKN